MYASWQLQLRLQLHVVQQQGMQEVRLLQLLQKVLRYKQPPHLQHVLHSSSLNYQRLHHRIAVRHLL